MGLWTNRIEEPGDLAQPVGLEDRFGGRRVVERYVLREFLLSFAVAFSFFFFAFFINQILLLAEDILTKDVPLGDVLRLILYSLPAIVALSFPFGSLVGALMTVGRLSADHELLALEASGVRLRRVSVPIVALGLAFSVFSFAANDIFLPLGTIEFSRLYRRLLYRNPALELDEYSITRYQDNVIVTGGVEGDVVSDLMILERNRDGKSRVIVSDAARIAATEASAGVISLILDDVVTHSYDIRAPGEQEFLEAESMTYNVVLRDIAASIQAPGPREMSSRDVYAAIVEKRSNLAERSVQHAETVERQWARLYGMYVHHQRRLSEGQIAAESGFQSLLDQRDMVLRERNRPITDRTLQIFSIEFHKKFSIPFGCVAFSILAFPVGRLAKRSGRSVGFGLGLFVAIVYWSLLVGGQTFGVQNQTSSAAVMMWLPNAVVIGAGIAILGVQRWRR